MAKQFDNLQNQFLPMNEDLSEEEVNREIARAFEVWADVSSLTFERKFDADDADIEIRYK